MRIKSTLTIIGLALLMALSLPAQTVRVVFVSGNASIQRPDEALSRAIQKGETVIIGSRIVTGADGRVVLTPMNGVKSIITPNTTLLIESVSEKPTDGGNGGVTQQATLDLKEGAVVSDLEKQPGVTFDYNIRTTRGIAGARGTNYTVGINAAGVQTVIVSHGNIALTFTNGTLVSIAIGQIAITQPNGANQSINNINQLSPADQKIAQNWTNITVAAIATAVEAGELPRSALDLALEAAARLGIPLTPEVRAIVDRVRSLSARIDTPTKEERKALEKEKDTIIPTIDEVSNDTLHEPEQQYPGYASFAAYQASLTGQQQIALGSVLSYFENPEALESKLSSGQFAHDLTNVLQLYHDLNLPGETLHALGILANDNTEAVGADLDGLRNLIIAYQSVDFDSNPAVKLVEADYGQGTAINNTGANFFFPGGDRLNSAILYNITFDATGSSESTLRVGATRRLVINNTNVVGDTFSSNFGVELRASDIVDLNSTRFGPSVTSILIEATTINLVNIDFANGSSVTLNSRDGGTANGSNGAGIYPHFGSSVVGRVNFITGVKYDGNAINNTTDFDTHAAGHINIGKINQPVTF